MAEPVTGSCNCGGVKYSVTGPLREVIACHCSQCRKQTGHYFAATMAANSDLTIKDSGTLKWYAASDEAKRGFCSECGSGLFWRRNDTDTTSILAGTLDGDAGGIKMERHIFVGDKGAYYDIDDGLPQDEQYN